MILKFVIFNYPGAHRDRLFQAAYTHQGGKNCKRCDGTQAVERRKRPDGRPRIYYGTIGSSNMIVEDTQKRDELRDSMRILRVKTEAAGLRKARSLA